MWDAVEGEVSARRDFHLGNLWRGSVQRASEWRDAVHPESGRAAPRKKRSAPPLGCASGQAARGAWSDLAGCGEAKKKVMNNKWCPLSLDIFVSRDTEGRTAALCCQGTARTPVINKSTGLHYQCQCNAGDDPSFVCRDEAKEQTGRDVGVKLTRNAICIAPSSGNGSSCGSSSSSSVPSRPGVRLTRPRTAASIAEPKPHSRLDPCR